MSFWRSRYSWASGRPRIWSFDSALATVAESLSMIDDSAVTVTFSERPGPRMTSATVSWASWTWALRVTVCMPVSSNFTV